MLHVNIQDCSRTYIPRSLRLVRIPIIDDSQRQSYCGYRWVAPTTSGLSKRRTMDIIIIYRIGRRENAVPGIYRERGATATTACAAFPGVNYTLDPGETVGGGRGGNGGRVKSYYIIRWRAYAAVHQSRPPPRFGPSDDE